MSAGYYSQQMPYLEDASKECIHEVTCTYCPHPRDEQEGTHYLDSERFNWECSHCAMYNETDMPDCTGADPDTAHDEAAIERHFG